MKIVYFGTPQFAAEILSFLLDHGIEIAAVVTKPDRPKGRSGAPVSTPVKAIAQEKIPHIPVYQPEIASAQEFADTLRQYQADLFVVVAYGEIIKQHLLDMPRLGCINVHGSLLPKYRGAAPIQRSIMEGEKETGITIMHLVKKMDAGDIIKMASTPIGPDMTAGELETILCKMGAGLLLEVLHDLEKGIVQQTPQDHDKATLAPKIELEDCEIHWNLPAQKLHNIVRGANPHPGAWCFVTIGDEKKRLKIHKTRLKEGQKGLPGTILSSGKDGLIVACGEDALALLDVQLEGKKAMSAPDLVRGLQVPLVFT